MRKLKIDEDKLKSKIQEIIYAHPLGIDMNELMKKLEDNGFKVSPQVVKRNILKLSNEDKIRKEYDLYIKTKDLEYIGE